MKHNLKYNKKSKKIYNKKRINKKNKTKKNNRLNKKLLTKKQKRKISSLKKYSKKHNNRKNNNIRTKKLVGGSLFTIDIYEKNLKKIEYFYNKDIYNQERDKQKNIINLLTKENNNINNSKPQPFMINKKVLNKNNIDIKEEDIKQYGEKILILTKLGLFPFIVSLIGINKQNNKMYFENCELLNDLPYLNISNENMYTSINNKDNIKISACLDIAYGIQYLHEQNIIHRYICKDSISYVEYRKGDETKYLFKLGNFEYARELKLINTGNNYNYSEQITSEFYEIVEGEKKPPDLGYDAPEVLNDKKYYKESDLFYFGQFINTFLSNNEKISNIVSGLTIDKLRERFSLATIIQILSGLITEYEYNDFGQSEYAEPTTSVVNENLEMEVGNKTLNTNDKEYKTPSNIARNEKTFNYNERIQKHIEKQSPKVHGNKNPEKTEEDLEFEVEGLIFELFTDILPNENYKNLDKLLNKIKKKLNFFNTKKVFEENTKITEKEKEEIIKSPNFKNFIENYMKKINSIKEEYQENLELDRIYLLLIILHKELRTKDENVNFVKKIEFPPEIKIITDAICNKLLQEQTISYIKKKLPRLTDDEIIASDLFKYGKYLEYIQGSDEDGITDIDILKKEEMDILKFQKGKGLPPKIVIDTQGSEKKTPQPDVYYDTGIKLGGGQFGNVYQGTLTLNKNPIVVAVKVVKSDIPDENYKKKENEDLLEEAKLMSKLGIHPNIVSLIGIHKEQEKPEEPNKVCIQFCENGSLLSYLLKSEKITEKELIKICKHIANGMEYIVSKNIVHRDLAARNILVSQYNTFKVSDFGMSVKMVSDDSNEYTYTEEGKIKIPLRWCDPELLKNEKKIFSEGTDVWSFGIVMIEILQKGSRPYINMNNIQVIQYISSGNRISKPENCSDAIYNIIKNCWKEYPKDRYTFKIIKEKLKNIEEDVNKKNNDVIIYQENESIPNPHINDTYAGDVPKPAEYQNVSVSDNYYEPVGAPPPNQKINSPGGKYSIIGEGNTRYGNTF